MLAVGRFKVPFEAVYFRCGKGMLRQRRLPKDALNRAVEGLLFGNLKSFNGESVSRMPKLLKTALNCLRIGSFQRGIWSFESSFPFSFKRAFWKDDLNSLAQRLFFQLPCGEVSSSLAANVADHVRFSADGFFILHQKSTACRAWRAVLCRCLLWGVLRCHLRRFISGVGKVCCGSGGFRKMP